MKLKLALERIGTEIYEFGTFREWKLGSKEILRVLKDNEFNKSEFEQSVIQKFISKQFSKTVSFLKNNMNIIIAQADKGGKVVIMDKRLHNLKMENYLEENTKNHVYFKCNDLSVSDVSECVERKYDQLRLSINGFLVNDAKLRFKDLCYPLVFEPFGIPRINGNIKVHKDDFPIRPIISSINCQGNFLMEWLLKKLDFIAELLKSCRISNSVELFKALNGVQLDENHELVTWDYDSMYTNIPIDVAKGIIRKFYYCIEDTTTVPVDLFLEAISFLTEHSTYFLHNTGVYRQCKGLAMGNSLSKILAEIVTRSFIIDAIEKFSDADIRFLKIYIDDIFGIMNVNVINDVEKEILRNCKFLKLKVVRENERNEVNFLNSTIQRIKQDGNKSILKFKWYQKECSSKRILDFQSSHPISMKKAICEEFMKNALLVSDESHWIEVEKSVCSILDASNYPGWFIKKSNVQC